jgi:hypothetical protein
MVRYMSLCLFALRFFLTPFLSRYEMVTRWCILLGAIIMNIVWLGKEFCSSWSIFWSNFVFILHGRYIFSYREGRLIFSHLPTNTPVIIIICYRQHADISNKSRPTQYLYKIFVYQTLTSPDMNKVFIVLQLFNHLPCT